jgi:hypothetical protein
MGPSSFAAVGFKIKERCLALSPSRPDWSRGRLKACRFFDVGRFVLGQARLELELASVLNGKRKELQTCIGQPF